jgi:uncharacterized protein
LLRPSRQTHLQTAKRRIGPVGFHSLALALPAHRRPEDRLLPDSRPRSILIATGLGAASSSCSYAAVALARSIFRKGGDFIAAMAFQFASTNLVLDEGQFPRR